MQGLEASLKRKDADAHIFLAPKSLRVGGFWLPELAKEIAEASVFVLLVGPSGLGPWQVIEYYEALDRRVKQQGFPVILLLLDGQAAPGLPFLRQLHWIMAPDPSSEKCLAQLMDAADGGGTTPGALWRHTAPYRGLLAMTEADTDFFFGRERETGEVIGALATTPSKLPVLLGNSGVGKSSVAQAGVLAALMRQEYPETEGDAGTWPQAFSDSRRWCVLKLKPGKEPVRALVEPFIRTWQFDPTDPRRETRQSEWIENLTQGRGTLRGLLDATEDRLQEVGQSKPPAFLLYIDQGEELYVRADERQRHRFSKIVAEGLSDPRVRALMSMRADFYGELQKDEPLFAVHRLINVPPLRETELHDVVSRPAELLSARFETDRLASSIAQRAAEESTKDSGALPLLSYLLDDMWRQMIHRDDGLLRLPEQAIELGAVLVDRANSFLTDHSNCDDQLRRIFTLKLATVREDGEPTRRRAFRSEFSDKEWRLVSDLADHPNRLLVTATAEAGEIYAEVAHEAIFRRWDKLREWIAAEREFLAWRNGLEAARRGWQAVAGHSKKDALLMGYNLAQASNWLTHRAEDISKEDREFIVLSIQAAQQRKFRIGALVGGVALAEAFLLVLGFVGWINQSYIEEQWRWYATVRPFVQSKVLPYVLSAEAERSLIPLKDFRECATEQGSDYCPHMIVVPAGSFTMGSPDTEQGRYDDEGPQHAVTFARAFAASKFELTFDEWDTCVAYGDCTPGVDDSGWGRGQRPVINVTLDDAQRYVAWLSKMTGKPYRLLTEAEYEYATRADTTTEYFFGNDAAALGQYAWYQANSGGQTHRVGSVAPNGFGLYDMIGNVYVMVQDCYHADYEGAPKDGSAWDSSDCSTRVLRGGSWAASPKDLRSALRLGSYNGGRTSGIGFRVGRTLLTP
jgi:formylglycine-generating enzyme required for sulfatase activity